MCKSSYSLLFGFISKHVYSSIITHDNMRFLFYSQSIHVFKYMDQVVFSTFICLLINQYYNTHDNNKKPLLFDNNASNYKEIGLLVVMSSKYGKNIAPMKQTSLNGRYSFSLF